MIVTSSGQVTLANAGHLSPYLDGEELPVASGLPLGILADLEVEQASFFLPAKARLTLMSDGVVEARSDTGELYGFERTSRISSLPARDIAAEANRFGQEDDITVITLDWRLQPIALG
jgi:serine phosphatase RsbU (regulator of sigma subunit)